MKKLDAKRILHRLIEKYEHSVLSKEGSQRNLHIRFIMEKEMPAYFHYENYQAARDLEREAEWYERKRWVRVIRNDGHIQAIELNINKTEEICDYLGIASSSSTNQKINDLLETFRGQEIDRYIDDVQEKIRNYRSIKALVYEDIELERRLLLSLAAIQKLNRDKLERIFSAEVLGNSKSFEGIRSKAVHILKTYFMEDNREESDDDILASFHILRNPGHLFLKGDAVLKVGASTLNLSDFREGLTLSSADVEVVEVKELTDTFILTIENLTSFYQYEKEDTLVIYLGGYHNTIRREFLKRIYQTYPDKHYLHFGDIDAGGFHILNHLRSGTGIPFEPYLMNKAILKKYEHLCLPLTENDRKRLTVLRKQEEFRDVIDYMLEHNIKLEQEQIDLD